MSAKHYNRNIEALNIGFTPSIYLLEGDEDSPRCTLQFAMPNGGLTTKYLSGKNLFLYLDQCGRRYGYNSLKGEAWAIACIS